MTEQTWLELLKRLEWCGTADFQIHTVPRCPICKGLKDEYREMSSGHTAGCALKQVIDELEALQ
jgi:hypothetical protein